jgi:hypothetical protein
MTMEKLQILISSPEAEAVADRLKQDLSPIGDVTVRTLSSRGVDVFVVLEMAVAEGLAIALAEVIIRWVKLPRVKPLKDQGTIKITWGGKSISIETDDPKPILELLSHKK